MSSLETLNSHIDLCTRRLELEDQALLATAAGDYDQADRCDREIEQLTGQIEELNNVMGEAAAPHSEPSNLRRKKVFCPDCGAKKELDKIQSSELPQNFAEVDQGELQKLKHEFWERTTAIERATLELNKAITMLDHWQNEYLYCEKPDPQAAIACGSGAARGRHYSQSHQWYYEYNFITQFINIASDYVYSAKEALDQAITNN